jgi:hypothetical protein
MTRYVCFILLCFCFFSVKSYFGKKDDPVPDISFAHLLTNFQKTSFPYETGALKPTRLHLNDSIFIKSALTAKKLIAVTDTAANVWDDADDEGKVRIDLPELIGAGAFIDLGNGNSLLEIVDMYELKGASESNKQGVFAKTTFLCTFDKTGKLLSALVSNYTAETEHGSVNRWQCILKSANEITVKEYGNRKELKDSYSFNTLIKITAEGKLVKIRSEKGTK